MLPLLMLEKEKKLKLFKFNNSILFPLKLFINLKIKRIYLLAYKSFYQKQYIAYLSFCNPINDNFILIGKIIFSHYR